MQLTLVDIHDMDADHEVGGQDLPYLVTVKVNLAEVDDALTSLSFAPLVPFNTRRSHHLGLPGHIEFCTFSFRSDIQRFFAVEPEKSVADIEFDKYFRRSYVRTVGELRAAIADLPDGFPLIHTGSQVCPDGGVEHFNALGLMVCTGSWSFAGPGLTTFSDPGWSLRLESCTSSDWSKIMDGKWRNIDAEKLGK